MDWQDGIQVSRTMECGRGRGGERGAAGWKVLESEGGRKGWVGWGKECSPNICTNLHITLPTSSWVCYVGNNEDRNVGERGGGRERIGGEEGRREG